ncbi:hypothetical protein AQJ43_01035 [Streptomyces avermitilis]|nr:hypothetical protein AQJ43_01035 [Streptomyces avermitilis]OOV33048.1 hypothetical protein SM007_09780 [Streptomyces avermitilis]
MEGGPGEDDGRAAPQRGRRRVWRWAIGVWAAAVLVGGGLTLWLQDSTEPPPPTGWEPAPAPLLSADVRDHPPCPGASDGQAVLCVYATADPDR